MASTPGFPLLFRWKQSGWTDLPHAGVLPSPVFMAQLLLYGKSICYFFIRRNVVILFHIRSPAVNAAYASYRSQYGNHRSVNRRQFFLMGGVLQFLRRVGQAGKANDCPSSAVKCRVDFSLLPFVLSKTIVLCTPSFRVFMCTPQSCGTRYGVTGSPFTSYSPGMPPAMRSG